MPNSQIRREIDKIYNEVQQCIIENKTPRERNNFRKKQLTFLKAEVHHPKIPFKRGLLALERKKTRRLENIKRKQDIGLCNFQKKKK